jgi:tetratricopeptide (TPR) repeat protein
LSDVTFNEVRMQGKAMHGKMPQMRLSTKAYWAAVAAAAAMALTSGRTAQAQYRTGNDGHVLDNSNQVGSGGYNTTHDVNPAATGANLNYTYGNTAGLSAFQGNDPITDPQAFQGNIPEGEQQLNTFNRIAAGSSIGPQPGAGPTAYYGATRFVPPPPGFTQFGASGGYIAGTPSFTDTNDSRLGFVNYGTGDVADLPGNQLSSGGLVTNFVDTNPNNQQFYTSSPLYGAQQWSVNDFGSLSTNGLAPNGARLDDATIIRMRSQLNGGTSDQTFSPALNNPTPPGSAPNGGVPNDSSKAAGTAPGGGLINATQINNGTPGAAPTSGVNQPLNSSMNSGAVPTWRVAGAVPLTPLNSSGTSTDQSMRQQLLATPAQQSTQYAELQRRLAAYDSTHHITDEQANQQLQQEQQALKNSPASAAPAGVPSAIPSPAGAPVPGAIPAPAATPGAAPTDNSAPMQVNTLSEGVGASGLHDILANAEELMKQGRFNSAVDEYNTAAAIAPNNPLITLGRANAELGAANYARCELDLRQAYTGDQSLMMAQYNVGSLIGKDRLDQVVSELKQNAVDSPNDETPVFLLAYIAYNMHDSAKAAGYLQLAQQREGGQDALLVSLRQHWNLPTTQPSDLNK